MSESFEEILNKSADEVKAPPVLPEGTYKLMVTDYEMDRSSQKKTPYVQYNVRPVEAVEVDEDELGEVPDWQEKKLNFKFYLSENAQFMVKEFAESLGIETSGRTLGEIIPEINGMEILGGISKQFREGSDRAFNPEVKPLGPAD